MLLLSPVVAFALLVATKAFLVAFDIAAMRGPLSDSILVAGTLAVTLRGLSGESWLYRWNRRTPERASPER